jgi:hypothetical protein
MIGNQAEIRVKTGAVYENTGSLTSIATLCGFMVSCFGFTIKSKVSHSMIIPMP